MKGILDLELGGERLERAWVDLAIAGLFADEFPLRGGAGRVDWRLCGLVSQQIASGQLSGARGEVLLIPSWGQLRARRVMILGLGPRSRYRLEQLAECACEAIERAAGLRADSVALAPLGVEGDDFPRCAEAFVTGAREGFRRAAQPMRVRIVLPGDEVNRSAVALEAALDRMPDPLVRFRRPAPTQRSQTAATALEPAAPYRTQS
ncbi:MAG: M17 family peptidase N-terminal domain-containing protein [Myxococcota bacterium]|nr:M17 family peptidase N-terminal domain-containing protein [Myxococcota bacterium]